MAFSSNHIDGSTSVSTHSQVTDVEKPQGSEEALHSLEIDTVPRGTSEVAYSTGDASQGTHPAETPHNRGYTKLLVLSAYDERSLKRTIENYTPFYHRCLSENVEKLDRLAFTLAERRSHMQWRTFAIVNTELARNTFGLVTAKSIRALVEPRLAFVFTGQGAQYVKMGFDLVRYPIFKQTLQRIDENFTHLGCQWSIFGKITILWKLKVTSSHIT